MVVQHNLTAMNANRYFGINNNKLSKSLEKLSSGYAINRAGDNAAGLAVSEKMRSQIAGMTQGVKNAQDGISMVQTYEGALTETDSILQRMKTLATQMSNGSYDNEVDRSAAQLEFDQLNDELNQIADTDFKGVVVLNGGRMADGNHNAPNPSTLADVGETGATSSMTDILYGDNTYTVSYDRDGNISGFNFAGNNLKITVDAADDPAHKFTIAAGQKITIDGVEYTIKDEVEVTLTDDGELPTDTTIELEGGEVDIKAEDFKMDVTGADGAITKDKDITGSITKGKETYYTDGTAWYDANGKQVAEDNGAFATLVFAANGLAIADGTVTAATDDDPAKLTFTATLTADKYAKNATAPGGGKVSISDSFGNGRRNLTYADSITLQVGARSKDAVEFTFKYSSDGIGDLTADLDCSARGLGTDQLSIASQEDANYAIDQIDNAINKVSMVRATFGAVQNRLEHKIDNLNVNVENMTSAESRIRDTNMAEEMMNFTKNQILSQASQSMLAQANQLPQSVLQLLQ